MSFSSFGLAEEIVRATENCGYTEATPIQTKAIPAVLSGKDLLARAQTGTGKTAGFVLPILHKLADKSVKGPSSGRPPIRALILTPTRELATQIQQSVSDYGQFLKLDSMAMFGGSSMHNQLRRLRSRVDILVATPGRLLDHLNRGSVELSQLQIVVLDEADRMLDMGFIRDVRKILAKTPKQRQNLLFSATFSKEIEKLARDSLNDPVKIEVAPENAPAEKVEQKVFRIEKRLKSAFLRHLIAEHNWYQVLVFMRTKHGANKVTSQLLKSGTEAAVIHGGKRQNARTKALEDFKKGKVQVLVATDIAARGLDINNLPMVINFDLPHVAEDYVHRIGRTGRAGAEGAAISLVSKEEAGLLKGIERLIGFQIPYTVAKDFAAPERQQEAKAPTQPKKKPGNRTRNKSHAKKPRNSGQRKGRGPKRKKVRRRAS